MDSQEPSDSKEGGENSIEENGDAKTQWRPRHYNKTSGFNGFRGEAFEYKTCSLVYVRGSSEKYNFELGSSVDIYRGFDDIVFVCKTPENSKFCLFLQLKNKARAKVRFDNLVSEKNDFSLVQMYDAYCRIQDKFNAGENLFSIDVKFENCIFVLYTNADVDCKSLKLNDKIQHGPEKIALTGGSILRLNENDHKNVYEKLKQDRPKIKEFLEKFVIMYKQASEDQLDNLIKNEIHEFLELSEEEKESAFYKFQTLIQNWWKKPQSAKYLTSAEDDEHNLLKQTSEHIKDMQISSLMKERKSEIERLGLQFSDNGLAELKGIVGCKKVVAVITPQHSMKLTSAKMHQLLGCNAEYGILKLEDFNKQIPDILNNHKFRVFVMLLENHTQEFNKICSQLSCFLSKDSQNTKIIFIVNEDNTKDKELLVQLLELEIYVDSSTYDSLSPETKTVLLKRSILFQGCEIELNQIGIRTLDWLDQQSISLLLLQEDKLEIGSKPPGPVDCYINRTLKCHVDLNQNIRKLKRIPSTWIPESLLEGDDRIIIVTAEPGMGKSTLLTHLFRTTKERYPNKWVVRVNINDFTKMLDGFKKSGVEEDDVLKLLEVAAAGNSTTAITEIEKKLLHYSYKVSGNLIVLVDGMDEISPDYSKEAFRILKELYQSRVEKIWVTTRPHLKHQLESLFRVHSVSLIPFNKEDQNKFLTQYWTSKVENLNEETLSIFLNHLLEISTKFLSEKDLDFMGIPLQILLLAEMYLEKLQSSNPTQELGSLEYANNHYTMLYEKYIERKWRICNEEKLKTDVTKVQARKQNAILKKKFIEDNMFAAMLTLFSDDELNSLNDKTVKSEGKKYLEEIEEEGDKTGLIVRVSGGKAQFVHRTVAEYFAAKWIFRNLEKNKTLLKKYIFKSKHKVIRRLLDYFLLEDHPLHVSVLNGHLTKNSEGSINECDVIGRTPLHIAVMYELPDETKTLLELGADINIKDKLMEWSPVEYAEKICTLSAEDLDGSLLGTISMKNKLINAQIMNSKPETIKIWASKKNPSMCHESYLYIAAKHGLENLLNHFVKNRVNINAKVHGGHRILLHELAYFGHAEPMKMVLKLGAKCDIIDGYGNTALHLSVLRNHANIVTLLLEAGVNINSGNLNGCTALHLAVILYQYDMVKLLVSKGADVNSKDDYGYTPLSIARSSNDTDMIKLLPNSTLRLSGSEE